MRRAWTAARLPGGALIIAALVWRLGVGPFLDGLRGLAPRTLLAAAQGGLWIALILLLVAVGLGASARYWSRLAARSRVGAATR